MLLFVLVMVLLYVLTLAAVSMQLSVLKQRAWHVLRVERLIIVRAGRVRSRRRVALIMLLLACLLLRLL